MNDKFPIMYEVEEQEFLQNYVEKTFFLNEGCGGMFHELNSEYVHTDVFFANDDDMTVAYTVGMSAREMFAPPNCPKRVELMLSVRGKMEVDDMRRLIVAHQLQSVSKLPFEQDTWIGQFHTVDATPRFEKEFGYSAFLFFPACDPCVIDGEEILYLHMIPLYADEYEWIVEQEQGSLQFLCKFYDRYGSLECYINEEREHIDFSESEDEDEGL